MATATDQHMAAYLRAGPHDAKVTRAEVLEIGCRLCRVPACAPCDTRPPRPALAGLVFAGMSGLHLRRVLDRRTLAEIWAVT